MYKVDKLQCFLDCDLCNKVLIDPVVMPCDSFICKTHLDKLISNASAQMGGEVIGSDAAGASSLMSELASDWECSFTL